MSQIIEIGFEIRSHKEYQFLETLLCKLGIPFYVEPGSKFNSLADLACHCEGE